MDNKTFVNKIAQTLNIDPKEAASLTSAFAQVLSSSVSKLDSIAIPGFGNFISVKLAEKVIVNPDTGNRTLCPPQIKLQFVPSTVLKKSVGA